MTKKHCYEIDGELLARVTSITGQLAKPPLVPWAAKCAVDYLEREVKGINIYSNEWLHLFDNARTEYKRQSDEAKEIGELVHHKIHAFLKGQLPIFSDLVPDINNSYKAFLKWYDHFHPRPLATEQLVHNKCRKRAGTFDFLGHIKDPKWRKHRLYLIDWKTSKSLYFEDLIQIALYFYDYQLLTGTKIAGAANLRLDKETGKYQWKPYPRYKLRNAYRIGNHLTAIWHLRHGK